MADETRSLKMAPPLLAVGAALHLAGLLLYDSFPFLYLSSIPVLSFSYYLSLAGNGYRPLATPAFWGVAVVLAIPIAGPLAGVQKILFTPKKGTGQSKQSRLMSSLVSLLLFIPMIVFLAALIMPVFPEAPAWSLTGILICAAIIEAALIAAVLFLRRKI